MKEPVFFQADQSFKTLDYTYSFSKYSCVAWVYPLHIMFAYLVVLTGILAMLSRIVDKLRPYHVTFGRWYLLFMFWCMACSLLIYTNGLPFPIIISFLYLLISMTVGWNAISVHTSRLRKQVSSRINKVINSRKSQDHELNIQAIESEEKGKILRAKTFKQRLFSYKMLHGLLMSFSWYQIAGRTMVTNPFNYPGCWTYPAYKSPQLMEKVYPVDSVSTPPFPMPEGQFLAMITIPTVIVLLLVAFGATFYYYKADQKIQKQSKQSSTLTEKLSQ